MDVASEKVTLQLLVQPVTAIPKNAVVELKLPASKVVKFADSASAPTCEFYGATG
jgi:hypothetical protein